ncbi:hypothetical protein D7Z96_00205 [Pseudarthrobacter phenanthrenivorans]|uniref:Uncharacterized protein n=1 Tax=Pseudarthrobacter phenanthrenivorans TaxID=361575 RepID=A0A3B0G5F4_PSEPS|nr:hypothetical protein [Pseudarthrobacter phenanthrenivorans]RKO27400.1 hypothetical protein D7Z96_00205 [Pseudarthrobacter phenanthrenivorans]
MKASLPAGQGNHVFHTSKRWPLMPTPDLMKLRHTLQWSREFADSDEAQKLLHLVDLELHLRTRGSSGTLNSRPRRPG